MTSLSRSHEGRALAPALVFFLALSSLAFAPTARAGAPARLRIKNGHSLTVALGKLVLDAARFLPGHVYRLELRLNRLLVGSALVYLYPPPAERVSIDAEAAPTPPNDDGFGPAPVAKGGL
jgi:hypothetical protein